ERNLILFVGRLWQSYKGAQLVAELGACGDLQTGDWRFVIAGAGPPDSNLSQLCSRLPNVELIADPGDDQLRDLFSRAAVLLLPSQMVAGPRGRWDGGEGFGIVILEAAIFGLASVTSDQGACPETVARLGSGVSVPPTL